MGLIRTVEQTIMGTPAFMAPEVIRRGKHTIKTDIWSLGVTVYEMITGDLPFPCYDTQQLLLDVSNGPMKVNCPQEVPGHAREFIEACLAFKPEDRPSAKELLQYEFIMSPSERETIDLPDLEQLLRSRTHPSENEDIVRTDVAVAGELSYST